jgi:hypothetical protein
MRSHVLGWVALIGTYEASPVGEALENLQRPHWTIRFRLVIVRIANTATESRRRNPALCNFTR